MSLLQVVLLFVMESLQFNGDDPGAVRLGNFINYYDFHPPEERLKLLPNDVWLFRENQQYTCLDIGCNTGALTTRVYEHISNSIQEKNPSLELTNDAFSIVGIDIDPVLIQRAQEQNKYENGIIFKCLDFMSDERTNVLHKYIEKCSGQFDVVFCFSVTMWIHLNHGDDGLNRFLKDVSEISRMIVIEPQPWKCYKSAVKRLKRCQLTFPRFQELTIRENVEQHIELFLTSCDFQKIQESVETKWGRKLLFFTRCDK